MKKIFIKYNPFTLKTIVKADGKNLNEESNSSFNKRQRLQEYNLIEKLDGELNFNGDYHIKFHGTGLDYEDIKEYAKEKSKNRNIQLEHIKSREVKDRKKEVENIFYEIQNNSYDLENLKSEDLKDRFEKILNSEFEINVIATMSSGKSTLINSLLSKKILPSKNKACTATITRIKDTDKNNFIGKAYSKIGKLEYKDSNLSYKKMKEWNENENISTIEIEGEIPFVKANEISLVITDTPGPNNSRDEKHKQRLMNMLDNKKYKPLILYVLNATQLGINDDNELLDNVIAKLKNADKQTRDRFLFVLNKLDCFNEDDDISETMAEVCEYLEDKGVEKPNIFPVAALPALIIKSEEEKQKEKRKYQIKEMNDEENLHLEKYISLPPKAKQEIENELKQAIGEGDQEKTALIHTGIPSLEKIIKTYIEKYAIAIKIKDLTDLFKGIVNDELKANQQFKQINEINDEKKTLELKEQIKNINHEIFNLKKFDSYNEQIRQSSRRVAENLEIKIKKIEKDLSIIVTNYATDIRNRNPKKVKIERGKALYAGMIKTRKNIEIKLKNELKNAIQKGLVETLEELYKEYINRLKRLTLTGNKIIDGENLIINPLINPFEMMEGNIESFRSFDEFRSEYSEKKNEVIGTKDVENQREWWEFWRWLESPTKIINVYGDVEYIGINDFTDTYVSSIEIEIRDTTSKALEHSKKEIVKIQKQFIKTKEQLDKILKNKLDYISELLQNKEKTAKDIKIKSEMYAKKIEWLKNIKNRIENVIEI